MDAIRPLHEDYKHSQQTVGKQSMNAIKQKTTDMLFFFFEKISTFEFEKIMPLKLEFLEQFLIGTFLK